MQRHLTLHDVDPRNSNTHNTNPFPKGFGKVDIPEGQSGPWAVEKFAVTAEQVGLTNLRAIRDGNPQRIIPPGEYTRLVRVDHEGHHGRTVVMSDTPAEAWDHALALTRACGRVLINGLGLGFYLAALLRKSKHQEAINRFQLLVSHVTVVERSEDVIKLVAPHFANDSRVEIVNDDASEYKPPRGSYYDFVWHDIWDNICEDHLPEMTALRRKYGRRAMSQGCWGEEYLR